MIAINSVPDHLHYFVGLEPNQSVSKMMQLVKGYSSEFINIHGFSRRKFQWQAGFGTFSNSRSQIDKVVKYILNQKEHHRKINFRDEYIGLLNKYGVAYDEKYLFHELLEE